MGQDFPIERRFPNRESEVPDRGTAAGETSVTATEAVEGGRRGRGQRGGQAGGRGLLGVAGGLQRVERARLQPGDAGGRQGPTSTSSRQCLCPHARSTTATGRRTTSIQMMRAGCPSPGQIVRRRWRGSYGQNVGPGRTSGRRWGDDWAIPGSANQPGLSQPVRAQPTSPGSANQSGLSQPVRAQPASPGSANQSGISQPVSHGRPQRVATPKGIHNLPIGAPLHIGAYVQLPHSSSLHTHHRSTLNPKQHQCRLAWLRGPSSRLHTRLPCTRLQGFHITCSTAYAPHITCSM
eukprot:364401-Chlamydomonas_euryale.AAC.1